MLNIAIFWSDFSGDDYGDYGKYIFRDSSEYVDVSEEEFEILRQVCINPRHFGIPYDQGTIVNKLLPADLHNLVVAAKETIEKDKKLAEVNKRKAAKDLAEYDKKQKEAKRKRDLKRLERLKKELGVE